MNPLTNYSFIGTFDQLMDIVPTYILSILKDIDKDRIVGHVYRITLYNNFILIW